MNIDQGKVCVDALNRNVLSTAMIVTECEYSILAKLRRKQEDDMEIINIRERVMKDPNEEYVIKNGLLYRKLSGDALIVVCTKINAK